MVMEKLEIRPKRVSSRSEKFKIGRINAGLKLRRKILPFCKDNSRAIAYILGVLHGDGYINKYTMKLKVKDFDFAKTFAKEVLSWTGRLPSIRTDKNGLYIVNLHSIEACSILSSMNSNFINCMGEEERCCFLRGIFDSEGSVAKMGQTIYFYNSDYETIELVSALLTGMKIRNKIIARKNNIGVINGKSFTRRPSYVIAIRDYRSKNTFKNMVGFSIRRKQERLEQIKAPKNMKLQEETIREIINLRMNGLKYIDIARRLNVGHGSVCRYLKGVN